MTGFVTQAPVLVLRFVIRVYQLFVAPLLGPRCRFHPSCSHYAAQAIATHGAIYGSWLAVKRIGRCHPWSEGGFDPVPQSPSLNLTGQPTDHRSCCSSHTFPEHLT